MPTKSSDQGYRSRQGARHHRTECRQFARPRKASHGCFRAYSDSLGRSVIAPWHTPVSTYGSKSTKPDQYYRTIALFLASCRMVDMETNRTDIHTKAW